MVPGEHMHVRTTSDAGRKESNGSANQRICLGSHGTAQPFCIDASRAVCLHLPPSSFLSTAFAAEALRRFVRSRFLDHTAVGSVVLGGLAVVGQPRACHPLTTPRLTAELSHEAKQPRVSACRPQIV